MAWSQFVEQIRRTARREAERVLRLSLQPRLANLVEWDPKTHRAKVELQPEGVISNWIPVTTPWVGNGWGVVSAPPVGVQCFVAFPEYAANQGVITGFVYDQRNPPPQGAKDGDLMLVHQTGSWAALTADGKIRGHAAATVELGNQGEAFKKLIREEFKDLYNNHKHSGGAVPDEQMTNDHMTLVLKGN